MLFGAAALPSAPSLPTALCDGVRDSLRDSDAEGRRADIGTTLTAVCMRGGAAAPAPGALPSSTDDMRGKNNRLEIDRTPRIVAMSGRPLSRRVSTTRLRRSAIRVVCVRVHACEQSLSFLRVYTWDKIESSVSTRCATRQANGGPPPPPPPPPLPPPPPPPQPPPPPPPSPPLPPPVLQ
jgi:hypothetical protein